MSIVKAKLRPPAARGARPRPRLFQALDRARARPVTWISAAPGAGKSTLAATWVKARGLRCLWYQLDAEDGDLGSFFHYLSASSGRARQPLPSLTPEYLNMPGVFARHYFERLSERVPPPAVLVLDNYQDVPQGAPLHAALREGVRALPRGWRLLVLSRDEAPPAWARSIADGDVQMIDGAVLRMTEQEVSGLVRDQLGRTDPVLARRLLAFTEGWAAGLALLLQRARWTGAAPDLSQAGTRTLAVQLDQASLVALTSWRPQRFGDRWLREVTTLGARMGDPTPLIMPTMGLALRFGVLGRPVELEASLQLLDRLVGRVGQDVTEAPWFRLHRCQMDSFLAMLAGDRPAAERAAVVCAALSARYGASARRTFVTLMPLYLALREDDLADARRCLARTPPLELDPDPVSASASEYCAALLDLREGAWAAARERGERALALADQIGDPLLQICCHLMLADLSLEEGRPGDLEDHLRQAGAMNHDLGSLPFSFDAEILRAEQALRGDDEAAQRDALRRALAIGRSQPVLSTALWYAPRMRRVLGLALRWGIEPEYARVLILRHGMSAPEGALAEAEWAWRLKIRALGELTIERDGAALQPPGPTPARLLGVLLCTGGVRVERLIDALWPEADGDRGRRLLDTNLHRLRRWLGVPEIVQLQEGRVVLDRRWCWVDLWEVEVLMQEAEGTRRAGRSAAEVRCRLGALYRGPLLQEEPLPLVAAARERLQGRLKRILGRLSAGGDEEAARLLQNIPGLAPRSSPRSRGA